MKIEQEDMTSFQKRLKKFFTLDIIRLLKILEMIQFSPVALLTTIGVCYIYNRVLVVLKKRGLRNEQKEESKNGVKTFLLLFLHTTIFMILSFYIRKFSMIMPSISKIIYPSFIRDTTLEYILHIALFIGFVELIPEFKILFKEMNEVLLSSYNMNLLYTGVSE
tara:strand:+ start:1890 stop:2381 length:492 start_codon:yes stop_codon:yes gene_type:complete